MARQPRHKSRPARAGYPRNQAAFTLLEVLAAVTILAIWYVVIAAMATDGLRKEGMSNRLLEASEIANRVMAEILTTTLNGSAPESRDEETEEGIFLVHVFIVPFGFGTDSPEEGNRVAQTGDGQAASLEQLVTAQMPGMSRHLVAINVRVAWEEGPAVKSVKRRTYAFNLEAARGAYQSQEAKDAGENEESRQNDTEEAEKLFEELG